MMQPQDSEEFTDLVDVITTTSTTTTPPVVADLDRITTWRLQLGILSSSSSGDSSSHNNEWASQLAQQRAAYARLVQQYPYPELDHDDDDNDTNEDDGEPPDNHNNNTTTTQQQPPLDPLTAMWMEDQKQSHRLQQLDLQYRKEKARRKRHQQKSSQHHTRSSYNESETMTTAECQLLSLQLIDKDLARLPHPDQLHGTTVGCSFRHDVLRQVLFVYSCVTGGDGEQHAAAAAGGYQQGMHEIASHVLYAAELQHVPVDENLVADTYQLVSVILRQLRPAYDIVVMPEDDNHNRSTTDGGMPVGAGTTETTATPTSASPSSASATMNMKPLEQMSHNILKQLSRNDPLLYQTWMSSSLKAIPPQLIVTKWIRLLFSREVTAVLPLWDALFRLVPTVGQLQSQQQSQSSLNHTTTTVVPPLQTVAEAAVVARLLVHRAVLLEKHEMAVHHHHGASGGASNSSDLLHYLMNMPVEESIQPMLQFLVPLLHGESVTALLPVFVPNSSNSHITTTSSSSLLSSSSLPVSLPSFDGSRIRNASSTFTQAFHSISTGPTATSPLRETTTTTGAARFSFSSVTEKLATQTQVLGKLLHHEWDHLAAVAAPTTVAERNYDDPPPRRFPAADPYAPPMPSYMATTPTADPPLAVGTLSPAAAAVQMQTPLAVLQQFVMHVQQEQRQPVPLEVWEALAQLEVIRTKLSAP